MAATAAGFAVARLAEVVPADVAADAPASPGWAEVEGAMQEDLEAQFAAALRARAGVTINPACSTAWPGDEPGEDAGSYADFAVGGLPPGGARSSRASGWPTWTPRSAPSSSSPRAAQHLPAGKRRGRRRARPLLHHRPRARPDLALPRRPAEINRHALSAPHAFAAEGAAAGQPPRRPRREPDDLPAGLPPMAAGLFGYLGYDMVRLMEGLPARTRTCSACPTRCWGARP